MRTSVEPMGNGLGIKLPISLLQEQGLTAGSELEVTGGPQGIVLSPVSRAKSKLEELVSLITDDNMHELVDWGAPVGGEVW